VPPSSVVVIGDIGSDMEAAQRAGAHGILVPTEVTLPEEVEAAPAVARDLRSAVALALGELAPEDLPAVAGSRT
jgi:phosphoglycolate phosphatase-like HAD superfamily hydrolase